MIRIIQGNPGSGKSYYAVNYLSKYTKYDPLYQEHVLNDGVLVITNIEGLRLKHLNLSELVDRFGIEKFFTVENFERIQEKYRVNHIVVIVDEAQKIFDSKFYDKDVFYFFQYHRHLGIDIFLLTQSVSTIARQMIPLCEFVIEAQPRSKGIFGVFRYKFKDVKGNFMYSQVARKKPELFKMYQSFKSDEAEKPRNVILYWSVVAVIMSAVVVIGFKAVMAGVQGKARKPVQLQKKSPVVPPSQGYPVGAVSPVAAPAAAVVPPAAVVSSALPPAAGYWVNVPVSGKVESGTERYVVLLTGRKVTRFRDFDAISSTADIPASLAVRLPISGGEPAQRETSSPGSIGGIAPEKQGATLATPAAAVNNIRNK